MFHFSSSICGPSIDFKDFRSFINLENEYQEIPIVNCLKVTAVKALQWLILLALYFSLLPKFPLEWIASEDFSRLGALSMVGYYQIALLTIRIKYYVGWKLSHNGMILCGLAYYTAVDPATKQTVEKYDRAKNFDIYVVELNPNIKQKLTVREVT